MDDRAAIAALIYAYAERIDAGDFAGVAELFEHATYGALGAPALRGAAAVLDVFRRLVHLHDDGTPRTKHVTTNLVIDLDAAGGTASARSYFTVLQATATLPLQVVAAGRYHDRFERVGGQWRFAERIIFLDLTGDLSQHLRPE
jgi:3-phenylpropionate/cinnamic acid dioxygenase small subunit